MLKVVTCILSRMLHPSYSAKLSSLQGHKYDSLRVAKMDSAEELELQWLALVQLLVENCNSTSLGFMLTGIFQYIAFTR